MKVGDKVTYHSHNKTEKGIVKYPPKHGEVFVVYHCDNNWDEYYNYTAALTSQEDLTMGWKEN